MQALAGCEVINARFQQSIEAPQRFFAANVDALSQACYAVAKRFHRGGRLLVFGCGGSTTDAQHVSVEFVHPVIVGKRALPAIALTNDIATVLGSVRQGDAIEIFARQIELLGAPDDIALGLTVESEDLSVSRGLERARELGMLTLSMSGLGEDALPVDTDYAFIVESSDAHVVQEVQETAYHILWETVHIFFEHEGLLQ